MQLAEYGCGRQRNRGACCFSAYRAELGAVETSRKSALVPRAFWGWVSTKVALAGGPTSSNAGITAGVVNSSGAP